MKFREVRENENCLNSFSPNTRRVLKAKKAEPDRTPKRNASGGNRGVPCAPNRNNKDYAETRVIEQDLRELDGKPVAVTVHVSTEKNSTLFKDQG